MYTKEVIATQTKFQSHPHEQKQSEFSGHLQLSRKLELLRNIMVCSNGKSIQSSWNSIKL